MISNKKKIFLVCNTHLICHPEGDSIRLLQALIELIMINKIKQNIINEVCVVMLKAFILLFSNNLMHLFNFL